MTKFPEIPNNRWRRVCDKIIRRFTEMQYPAPYIGRKCSFFRKLLMYLVENRKIDFPVSVDCVDSFLRYCGHPPFNSSAKRTDRQRFCHHAMRVMLELHQHGSFEYSKKQGTLPLPLFFENILKKYEEYRTNTIEITSQRSLDGHLYNIAAKARGRDCTISAILSPSTILKTG